MKKEVILLLFSYLASPLRTKYFPEDEQRDRGTARWTRARWHYFELRVFPVRTSSQMNKPIEFVRCRAKNYRAIINDKDKILPSTVLLCVSAFSSSSSRFLYDTSLNGICRHIDRTCSLPTLLTKHSCYMRTSNA